MTTISQEVIIAAMGGFGERIPLLQAVGAVSDRELPRTAQETGIAAMGGFGERIPLLQAVGAVSNRELPWR